MTEQKLLTPEQVARYAADESQACPFCGGPEDCIDITDTTTGLGVQYDSWHCKSCHQSWTDELNLIAVHVHNNVGEDIGMLVPQPEHDAFLAIVKLLWPEEEPDRQWSPDTLDRVAELCRAAGYGPK